MLPPISMSDEKLTIQKVASGHLTNQQKTAISYAYADAVKKEDSTFDKTRKCFYVGYQRALIDLFKWEMRSDREEHCVDIDQGFIEKLWKKVRDEKKKLALKMKRDELAAANERSDAICVLEPRDL